MEVGIVAYQVKLLPATLASLCVLILVLAALCLIQLSPNVPEKAIGNSLSGGPWVHMGDLEEAVVQSQPLWTAGK